MSASRRAILLALVAGLCLAACSTTHAPGKGTQVGAVPTTATPKPTVKPKPPAHITITPADKQKSVGPRAHVTVRVTGGALKSVRLTNGSGHAIVGVANRTGTSWTSRGNLAYKTVYQVQATAKNATGQVATETASFHTAWPRKQVFPAVSPLGASTVGIGMPVVVYFPHPVADPNAVQAHLSVSSVPQQRGAWHWFADNTEAHWRPQTYWKAHSRVTVRTNIFGVQLGDGYWGKTNRTVIFHIGDRHYSLANSITHHMTVWDGTKKVKNFPVSMGKEVKGRWTHSGVHIVNARNKVKHMDSTTFGLALDAGGYQATVKYATRISDNGEFVHAAPWSVKQQGHSNVSHGCINLSPARAKWFYNFSRVGDVVQVIGTPVNLKPSDGPIYDWTVPWKEWVN